MKCSGLTEAGSQKLALIGVTPFSTWGRMTLISHSSISGRYNSDGHIWRRIT